MRLTELIPKTHFCDVCEAKKYKKCTEDLYQDILFIDGDKLNEICRKERNNEFPSSCDLILKQRSKQIFIENKYWDWFFNEKTPEKKREIISNKLSGSFLDFEQTFQEIPFNSYYILVVASFPEIPINDNDPEDQKRRKKKQNKQLKLVGSSALKINLMVMVSALFPQRKDGFIINGTKIPFDVHLCKELDLRFG